MCGIPCLKHDITDSQNNIEKFQNTWTGGGGKLIKHKTKISSKYAEY